MFWQWEHITAQISIYASTTRQRLVSLLKSYLLRGRRALPPSLRLRPFATDHLVRARTYLIYYAPANSSTRYSVPCGHETLYTRSINQRYYWLHPVKASDLHVQLSLQTSTGQSKSGAGSDGSDFMIANTIYTRV